MTAWAKEVIAVRKVPAARDSCPFDVDSNMTQALDTLTSARLDTRRCHPLAATVLGLLHNCRLHVQIGLSRDGWFS